MTQAVTAAYESVEAARNVVDELIADGFDQEKVYLDRDTCQVKVMTPDRGLREVEEILGRHRPRKLWSTHVH
ncbi:hypothetical protein [Aquisalimonas sp.]|uniref:hypothetical protein n=1 Tax=unclassified Aquisalimonas TaxID=2644645 RepID=UPI0025BE6C23|nr:hypothetical protein [Aquisalimonas sp.]